MNKIYPCIIGLGYVGLPLFLKLSKKFKSIANRALMFDPSIIHQSTTCTDKDFRALLVLNYS